MRGRNFSIIKSYLLWGSEKLIFTAPVFWINFVLLQKSLSFHILHLMLHVQISCPIMPIKWIYHHFLFSWNSIIGCIIACCRTHFILQSHRSKNRSRHCFCHIHNIKIAQSMKYSFSFVRITLQVVTDCSKRSIMAYNSFFYIAIAWNISNRQSWS